MDLFHKWNSLTEDDIIKEIGIRLKNIRIQRNLSQEELGRMIGKSKSDISAIENGKPITMKSFIRLLRYVDRLEQLDKILLVSTISPYYVEEKKKERVVRKRKKRNI